MTIYSYIVVHDGGFSPNPFFGYCTLACCKPEIRKRAIKGDWIVGLTPRAKGKGNKVVYFMQVEESLTFDQYWNNRRFGKKRPDVTAGMTRKQGDNIYEPLLSGGYHQLPSAHSKPQFKEGEDPDTKHRDTISGE